MRVDTRIAAFPLVEAKLLRLSVLAGSTSVGGKWVNAVVRPLGSGMTGRAETGLLWSRVDSLSCVRTWSVSFGARKPVAACPAVGCLRRAVNALGPTRIQAQQRTTVAQTTQHQFQHPTLFLCGPGRCYAGDDLD